MLSAVASCSAGGAGGRVALALRLVAPPPAASRGEPTPPPIEVGRVSVRVVVCAIPRLGVRIPGLGTEHKLTEQELAQVRAVLGEPRGARVPAVTLLPSG